jgi:hypothetical protein
MTPRVIGNPSVEHSRALCLSTSHVIFLPKYLSLSPLVVLRLLEARLALVEFTRNPDRMNCALATEGLLLRSIGAIHTKTHFQLKVAADPWQPTF